MPDTSQTSSAPVASSPAGAHTPGKALETSRGVTTIADSVVTKVAGIAAREVAGVYALGGSSARALGIDNRSQGVNVEVTDRHVSAEVTVMVEYGESIPEVAQEIRQQIIRRVEGTCGLQVTEVNVTVADLHFPGDEEQSTDRS